jgi:acetoacetyl-CoA reductase
MAHIVAKQNPIPCETTGHHGQIDFIPRVALITGGTGGIGSAICEQLAKKGHRVVTTYRNAERAKNWQHEMKAKGYQIEIYPCDVSDFEDVENLIKTVTRDVGPIEIVVNNAGITRDTALRKMDKSQWHDVISCNLDSVFNVTRCAIEMMIERGYGRIINISSINGQKGQFGQANYAAAKAGMHGFTKALAQEVARKGITVNTISPGYIETDMVMAVPEPVRNQIIAQIPVGRLGKPEDVAHVVNFLVSEEASFITGANIATNGGHFMD